MRTYDAILFDLDGTLIDTAPEIGEALNMCLDELGFARADAMQVRSWIGHGTRNLLTEALAARQGANGPIQADSVLPLFRRNYRSVNGRKGRLYPGVRETLDALHARRVPMGLVSNKEGEFGRQLLEVFRIARYFSLTVFGDSLGERKPAPAPIRHCMHLLRTVPPRTLLVGDSEIDVLTARNADVPVWAVSYGYRHKAHARELGADRVIDTVIDVLPYLRSRRPIWADRAQAGAE